MKVGTGEFHTALKRNHFNPISIVILNLIFHGKVFVFALLIAAAAASSEYPAYPKAAYPAPAYPAPAYPAKTYDYVTSTHLLT